MATPRGNFLFPLDFYFGPAAWVKSETFLRRRLAWLKANGYNIAVAMLMQDDWGHTRGNPDWTKPDPTTPLLFDDPERPTYGWLNNLDELKRRITIARRDYGIEVILSLWEQNFLKHKRDIANRETARICREMDPFVTAYLNTWEVNEIFDLDEQHWLNNLVGAAAVKPCGPHFAHFIPDASYWQKSNRANILWHQTGFDADEDEIRRQIRQAVTAGRVRVAGYEHTSSTRPWRPVRTLEEARRRGDVCLEAGAFCSING